MLNIDPAVLSKVSANVISGIGISILVVWGVCGFYMTVNEGKIKKQLGQTKEKKK